MVPVGQMRDGDPHRPVDLRRLRTQHRQLGRAEIDERLQPPQVRPTPPRDRQRGQAVRATRPPGNAIWPDQGSSGRSERLMKQSAGAVSGPPINHADSAGDLLLRLRFVMDAADKASTNRAITPI